MESLKGFLKTTISEISFIREVKILLVGKRVGGRPEP